jgi:hypothetical protein
MPSIWPHLTETQLGLERKARPGLIPVQLSAGQAQWIDMNGYHCYEGFFHQSLAAYEGLTPSRRQRFTSTLDFLTDPPEDSIRPSGFIFHMGRCGSTLLSKVLARSRAHLVFSEAAPHNQIWRILPTDKSGDPSRNLEMYRTLLLAMGRPRLPSYRAHIVKFTSFNIVKFDFIRAAFPGVPALFLFRDPAHAIDSYRRRNPSWMGAELGIGKTWHTPEAAIETFLDAALSIRDPDFQCVDHAHLTPDLLPAILRFFHLDPSMEEMRLMASEFAWDAKGGSRPRRFEPALIATAAVPPHLRELYGRAAALKSLR